MPGRGEDEIKSTHAQEASEMFTSKARNIIAALALSAGLFGAIAPLASAEDNSGTVSPGQTRASQDQCKMYKEWYEGDKKANNDKDAKYDKNLAKERGCVWAAVVVKQVPVGPVVGVGPIKVGPSLLIAP
jgi:hypothetical protein